MATPGSSPGQALRLSPSKQAKRHLVCGCDSPLARRVWHDKSDLVEGFTKRYGVHTLVWYEVHDTMESAIVREKAIKEWKRSWKLGLIEKVNAQWRDLYEELA